MHPRAKLGDKVRRKIRDRLREGYSEEELKQAIDGNHRSAWHKERKQHTLELIMRDSDHVNRFIELLSSKAEQSADDLVAELDRLCGEGTGV